MADLTYTTKGTIKRAATNASTGNGLAYSGKVLTGTTELAASASGSTFWMGRFPSNARVALHSDVYYDDLATSGSPTLDIGIGSVKSNITSDPDALNDGINLSSAASNARVVKDIANVGKALWEYVSGQTTDPGGELDIYGSIKDAATNAAGTVSWEIITFND